MAINSNRLLIIKYLGFGGFEGFVALEGFDYHPFLKTNSPFKKMMFFFGHINTKVSEHNLTCVERV